MTARMPTRATDALARSNIEFLRQGRELIERLSDGDFADLAPGSSRGGVGAHFRHVLDHYVCFLRGIEGGTVDYDLRDRALDLERVRASAVAKIDETCGALGDLSPSALLRPLAILVDCAEPAERLASPSTIARELQFLVSHTVHHYAVIAALLRARGIEPGVDFGVAPSTLKYERGNALCAR